jgi:6-phosphofructokinase 1
MADIRSGCQTYIIREGWEGLVRGNTSEPTPAPTPKAATSPSIGPVNPTKSVSFSALPPSKQLELEAQFNAPAPTDTAAAHADPNRVAPLSDAPLTFGFGELLKDGAGEGDVEELEKHGGAGSGMMISDDQEVASKSLKGRYIVRVGWDDVRGWLGEGGTLIGSSRCPSCELFACF